jgi:transcription elongation factor Elf1
MLKKKCQYCKTELSLKSQNQNKKIFECGNCGEIFEMSLNNWIEINIRGKHGT